MAPLPAEGGVPPMAHVLITASDVDVRAIIGEVVREAGHVVTEVGTLTAALDALLASGKADTGSGYSHRPPPQPWTHYWRVESPISCWWTPTWMATTWRQHGCSRWLPRASSPGTPSCCCPRTACSACRQCCGRYEASWRWRW